MTLTLDDFRQGAIMAQADDAYDQADWYHCVLAYARQVAGSDRRGPPATCEIEDTLAGSAIRQLVHSSSPSVPLFILGAVTPRGLDIAAAARILEQNPVTAGRILSAISPGLARQIASRLSRAASLAILRDLPFLRNVFGDMAT